MLLVSRSDLLLFANLRPLSYRVVVNESFTILTFVKISQSRAEVFSLRIDEKFDPVLLQLPDSFLRSVKRVSLRTVIRPVELNPNTSIKST